MCFVRLHVSEAEQERRIGSASRSEFGKLTSLATLRRLRNYRQDVEQPPADLEIDAGPRRRSAWAAILVASVWVAWLDQRAAHPPRPVRVPVRGATP